MFATFFIMKRYARNTILADRNAPLEQLRIVLAGECRVYAGQASDPSEIAKKLAHSVDTADVRTIEAAAAAERAQAHGRTVQALGEMERVDGRTSAAGLLLGDRLRLHGEGPYTLIGAGASIGDIEMLLMLEHSLTRFFAV